MMILPITRQQTQQAAKYGLRFASQVIIQSDPGVLSGGHREIEAIVTVRRVLMTGDKTSGPPR